MGHLMRCGVDANDACAPFWAEVHWGRVAASGPGRSRVQGERPLDAGEGKSVAGAIGGAEEIAWDIVKIVAESEWKAGLLTWRERLSVKCSVQAGFSNGPSTDLRTIRTVASAL